MKKNGQWPGLALALVLLGALCTPLVAEPLPGEVLKFQQLPMDGTLINGIQYWGHDELSTAWVVNQETDQVGLALRGTFMADDFSDPLDTPVVHVRWWGSYPIPGEVLPEWGVQRFLIGFESDIPANPRIPTSFSQPDPYDPDNLFQIVSRVPTGPTPPGTFTETLVPSPVARGEELYEYNAELAIPFSQEADTVYWLKIVALRGIEEPPLPWGWHNRDYTKEDLFASPNVFPGEYVNGAIPDPTGDPATLIWHHQDDAVTGLVAVHVEPGAEGIGVRQVTLARTNYQNDTDGPGPNPLLACPGIGSFSKDLAFELYTFVIPEPSTLVLLATGLAFALIWRRR